MLALAAEEQLRRQRQNVEITGTDQRAVRNALHAPKRGVERDRIALEGEAIFQREVDLIDVAGGDVVLRPARRPACTDRASRRACRSEMVERSNAPLASSQARVVGIVEAEGLAEEADPEQRLAPILRKQTRAASAQGNSQARKQKKPAACRPRARPSAMASSAGCHLARTIDGDDPLRSLEQKQCSGRARWGRGQTVVEENERGGFILPNADPHPLRLSSIAHMGAKHVNVEEVWP